MTNLEIALLITGQGMLGIFAVMGLITVLVTPVSYTHLTLPTKLEV